MKTYQTYRDKSRRHQLKSLRRQAECYLAYHLEALGFGKKQIRRFIRQINHPDTERAAITGLKKTLSSKVSPGVFKDLKKKAGYVLELQSTYTREFPQKSKP